MVGISASAAGSASAGPATSLVEGVSVVLPAEAKIEPKMGADSAIGEIVGPDFVCFYDYGNASSPLAGMGYTESAAMIDGRDALLVRKGPDFDGVHVGKIRESVIGDIRLTMTCESKTEAARDAVRAMFNSLKFDD